MQTKLQQGKCASPHWLRTLAHQRTSLLDLSLIARQISMCSTFQMLPELKHAAVRIEPERLATLVNAQWVDVMRQARALGAVETFLAKGEGSEEAKAAKEAVSKLTGGRPAPPSDSDRLSRCQPASR